MLTNTFRSCKTPDHSGRTRKKAVKKTPPPEMLDEYDFSKGVRGKYAKPYAEGTNVVVLAPDVAEYFPDSESVNAALRALVSLRGLNSALALATKWMFLFKETIRPMAAQ